MVPMHEKYRPRTFDEVVGQDKAVTQLKAIEQRGGFGGRAIWISGPSGSGKTTLARIIAGKVSDCATTEFDSGWDFNVEEADRFTDSMGYFAFGKGGRALIVNEAHTIRGPVIAKYLGVLERLPAHAVVIFTTTADGMEKLFDDQADAGPLLSRCLCIRLTNQGLAEAFAADLLGKARACGMDGKPLAEYIKLMKRPDVRNNYRAAWMKVESGEMMAGGAA